MLTFPKRNHENEKDVLERILDYYIQLFSGVWGKTVACFDTNPAVESHL